jgi:hypothetical protein
MRLLELTSAEVGFLTSPAAGTDAFQTRLTRKLGMTLTARLRLPVEMTVQTAADRTSAPGTPGWQPDAALATLWLTRRLGGQRGQRATGATTFVPPSLLHTLDAALAECWLDAPEPTLLPATLAWTITSDPVQARLAVELPRNTNDMMRWARGVIRHG